MTLWDIFKKDIFEGTGAQEGTFRDLSYLTHESLGDTSIASFIQIDGVGVQAFTKYAAESNTFSVSLFVHDIHAEKHTFSDSFDIQGTKVTRTSKNNEDCEEYESIPDKYIKFAKDTIDLYNTLHKVG